MLDDEILSVARKSGTISERQLTILPLLKNCDNWTRVKPVGRLRHRTLLAAYDGFLVELGGRAWFVRRETVAALGSALDWSAVPELCIA